MVAVPIDVKNKTLNMKSGIELIAKERKEQIEVHGYDNRFVLKNPVYYSRCQLSRAAMYILDGLINERQTECEWPEYWDEESKSKIESKSDVEKLIVAGALIAAEIDRIQNM